jgi:hypothetical protein
MAIFLVDLAVGALETRRVWVSWGIVLKRKTNPIGYWLMTVLWSLVALGTVIGVLLLSYQGLVGSGPYAEHAFLSLHQAWPYAATSILFGWLTAKIIKDRLQLRHRRPAA